MLLNILRAGHPGLTCLTIVGVCILFSYFGLLLSKKTMDMEGVKASKDGIIAYMNVVALLYAVLLAFLVIAVWENYEKNQSNVSNEANFMGSLFRNINTLPDSMKREFNIELEDYENAVVNKEWKTMENGQMSQEVGDIIVRVFNSISKFNKNEERNDIIFAEIYKEFNAMFECRRNRLIACSESLPSVLWLTLIVGTIATVFFSFYFYIQPFRVHVMFTVILAVIIGLTLFLVFVLEHPFKEPWKISSEVFEKFHLHVSR